MYPLISIMIPVYNVEKYLERCLDSVLAQTYTNIEVILVNDGSKDSSGEICDRYAEVDSRVKVFHKANEGVAATRNFALAKANGEYLMFVDSDDTIPDDAISVMYERMVHDGSDMAIGKHMTVCEENGNLQNTCEAISNEVVTADFIFSRIASKGFLPWTPWGKLYKRDLFDELCYPCLMVGEDTWIFPHIVSRCNKISLLDSIVMYYTNNSKGLTRTPNENKMRDAFIAELHMTEYLLRGAYKDSARRFFGRTVHYGLRMKNTDYVLDLIHDTFTNREVRLLLRGLGLKSYLKWLCLYVPSLYRVIRCVKTRLGYE